MCQYQHLKKTKWSKIENMSVSHMVNAFCLYIYIYASQLVKNLPAVQDTWFDSCLGKIPGDLPKKKGSATHSSILGLPWWLRCQRICLQCGRPGFDPWAGMIPWRRARQPTPVFLPGESPWTEEPGGLQSMGLGRVGHN